MKNSRKIIISSVLIAAVALIGFTTFQLSKGPGGLNGVITKTTGKALIGGQFEILNHDGKMVSDKDFTGRYMLIYFGYTFCPDVCPTELQVMTGALELLGDEAKQIQPVFVSVDPGRDTPAVMKEYVGNFYPGMIGLTGNAKQVAKIAKLYRVFYSKAAEKGAAEDEYAMDHSSIMYLMGPDGKFVKHFGYGTDPEKLAKALKKAMKS